MIAVQLATPADAEALSCFAEASFTDTFGHIYDPVDLATFLADWNPPDKLSAQIADPAWTVALVRGNNDAILGFAKLGPIDFNVPDGHPTNSATELHQLYVAPEAKGTGVAAALMDWGIGWARDRAEILYLSVFTENPRAQAFYRRYGFIDIGRNPFRVGNHIDEDRIWRLDL